MPLEVVAEHLRRAVDGTFRGYTVEADGVEFDVIDNDDRPRGLVDPEDGFLFHPYLVEVDWPDRDTPIEDKVRGVTTFLRELDRLGAEYVTAADFEDALPRGGRSS